MINGFVVVALAMKKFEYKAKALLRTFIHPYSLFPTPSDSKLALGTMGVSGWGWLRSR